MKLEVITTKANGRARPVELLFVHGIFSCAQIWQPFFQPYFAEHGYTSHAVSLRGHGRSSGPNGFWTTRLSDYVDDLQEVVEQIGSAPAMVGTSLGGVLVQHYLQRHSLPAAVLLASGPPHGMIPSALSMMATRPLLALEMSMMWVTGPGTGTVHTARRALFREDTPDDYIARVFPEPQPEPPLVALDALAWDLPTSLPNRDVPVLVLGAEKDAFITVEAVHSTARAFGVEAEVFPNMPHAMMLDEDWKLVANRMLEWFEDVLPSKRSE